MNSPFNPVAPAKARLTVADFLLLDANGSFADYAKTELIEGEIFYLNAQHLPHARAKTRLAVALARAVESLGDFEVIVEGSVAILPDSLPEPAVVIIHPIEEDGVIPLTALKLAVEVSDSTLNYDMGPKARLYAAAGVPEYWVVDIEARLIHQSWAPTGESYGEKRELAFGARLEAVTIPGLAVETANL